MGAKEAARGLTGRESEVLTYIGRGFKNREISQAMGVSLRTVEKHVERATRKLGARSRTQAVLIALAEGLLPDIPTSSARLSGPPGAPQD